MQEAAAHSRTPSTYRADIDGLRCIAVLSVLAFHGFAEWVPGGFVGVDMFFVISGYLITGILFKDLAAERFSFWAFYRRRIRRIFPALLVVIAACMLAGWYLLFDEELKKLSGYALAGLLSLGNVRNYLDGGYFAGAGDLTPLLHLWSLGVEEQFYLAWPVVLLLTRRRPQRTLVALLAIIAVSFTLNVVWVRRAPTAVFYLPFTRVWELGLGALLAWWETFGGLRSAPKAARNVVSLLGGALLAASLWLIDRNKPFPGWWATLPTLGSALAIAGGADAWLNRKLLSLPALTAIGLISYPLYLWHWPLLAFARTLTPHELSASLRGLMLGVSVLLAWLTYRLVEMPIRWKAHGDRSAFWLLGGSAALAIVAAAGHLRALQPRDRGEVSVVRAARTHDEALRGAMHVRSCGNLIDAHSPIRQYCMVTGDAAPKDTVVLWGDSHALMWSPAVYELAQKHHFRLVVFSHPGCAPLLRTRRSDPGGHYCDRLELGDEVVDAIAKLHPKHLLLAARWSLYSDGSRVRGRLQDHLYYLTQDATAVADQSSSRAAMRAQLVHTVAELRRIAPTTILRGTPVIGLWAEQGPERDPRGFEPTLAEHRAKNALPDTLIDEAARTLNGVTVLDPAELLCDPKCRAQRGDVVLYTDDNHLTAQAARLFSEQLEALIAPG